MFSTFISVDYALAYIGTFLLMYYVYNITPHKPHIDAFLSKYLAENGMWIITTIKDMNEFLTLDYDYSENKREKKSELLEEKKEE